jgi:hypothetical protein
MQEGKKKESVESFFEQLAEEQRAGIVAVGIDRSGAYQAAVAAWLPNADIVYDRFHLVMNVNQAVDEVRRTQCRKASKEDRQLIKGQRYLILGNQENLDADQGSSIREIPREAFLTGLYTVFCAFSLPECQEIPTKSTIPKAFPKASMSSRPSRTRATAGTLFTISAKSSSSPSPPCSAA